MTCSVPVSREYLAQMPEQFIEPFRKILIRDTEVYTSFRALSPDGRFCAVIRQNMSSRLIGEGIEIFDVFNGTWLPFVIYNSKSIGISKINWIAQNELFIIREVWINDRLLDLSNVNEPIITPVSIDFYSGVRFSNYCTCPKKSCRWMIGERRNVYFMDYSTDSTPCDEIQIDNLKKFRLGVGYLSEKESDNTAVSADGKWITVANEVDYMNETYLSIYFLGSLKEMESFSCAVDESAQYNLMDRTFKKCKKECPASTFLNHDLFDPNLLFYISWLAGAIPQ